MSLAISVLVKTDSRQIHVSKSQVQVQSFHFDEYSPGFVKSLT